MPIRSPQLRPPFGPSRPGSDANMTQQFPKVDPTHIHHSNKSIEIERASYMPIFSSPNAARVPSVRLSASHSLVYLGVRSESVLGEATLGSHKCGSPRSYLPTYLPTIHRLTQLFIHGLIHLVVYDIIHLCIYSSIE